MEVVPPFGFEPVEKIFGSDKLWISSPRRGMAMPFSHGVFYQATCLLHGCNDRLAGQLAAAQQRMRAPVVAGSCSAGVPAGARGAGVDDGTQYAELQPAAAADLARLAADADTCAVKLKALQTWLAAVKNKN